MTPMTPMTPTAHHYLTSPDRDVDTVLAYAHNRPNRFASRREAIEWAGRLGLDRYTIWYLNGAGRNRIVAEVSL